LCNRVAAPELLLSEAQAWAEQLAASAPLTLRYTKQALQRVGEMNLADAISYEATLQNYCMRSHDCAEGFRAVSEKRAPVFTGE
jgi:enoyl-CoA hydratase/carnithine racemase